MAAQTCFLIGARQPSGLNLSSCCLIKHTKDLSTMRAEPPVVIVNRGLMHWVPHFGCARVFYQLQGHWCVHFLDTHVFIQTLKLCNIVPGQYLMGDCLRTSSAAVIKLDIDWILGASGQCWIWAHDTGGIWSSWCLSRVDHLQAIIPILVGSRK